MNKTPEFTYEQALKSFMNVPQGDSGTGGRSLLRKVTELGLSEGRSIEQISRDIAERLGVEASEIRNKIDRCTKKSLLRIVSSRD